MGGSCIIGSIHCLQYFIELLQTVHKGNTPHFTYRVNGIVHAIVVLYFWCKGCHIPLLGAILIVGLPVSPLFNPYLFVFHLLDKMWRK